MKTKAPNTSVSEPEELPASKSKRGDRRTPPTLRRGGGGGAMSLEFQGKLNPEDPIEQRPLIGKDIAEWCDSRRMERLQAVQMLGMPTPHTFNLVTSGQGRLEPLPFDVEILLRRYLRVPIQHDQLRPVDVFHKIYGDELKKFDGLPFYDSARVMLYSRFGAMLGRTIFSVYRWFKAQTGVGAGIRGTLRRLFDMLPNDPQQMRQELEGLARITFKVRGYDFDEMFPLPDVNNPPPGRHVPRPRRVPRKTASQAPAPATQAPAAQAPATQASKRTSTDLPRASASEPQPAAKRKKGGSA